VRFLADENVEDAIVHSLRRAGHDVTCVGLVAAAAKDREVLSLARSESRILLTNDKDFGELVYRTGELSTGLVLLRFAAEKGPQKASLLAGILPQIEQQLQGHFAVVTEKRIRLRPLRPTKGNKP